MTTFVRNERLLKPAEIDDIIANAPNERGEFVAWRAIKLARKLRLLVGDDRDALADARHADIEQALLGEQPLA